MKETFYLNVIKSKSAKGKDFIRIGSELEEKDAIKELITNSGSDYPHYDVSNKGKTQIVEGYLYTIKLNVNETSFNMDMVDLTPAVNKRLKTIRAEDIDWHIKYNQEQAESYFDKVKRYKKLLKPARKTNK